MARVALVTGVSGFVGANLALHLAERGWRVVGLYRTERNNGPLDLLGVRGHPRVALVRGDVRDLALVRSVMAEEDITHVFHLAAQAIVSRAIRDPLGTVSTNVLGTATVLEAARAVGVERTVIQSTDKVYGEGADRREDAPLRPKCIYSATKVAADLLAQAYRRVYDMDVVVVRPSNLYGPGDTNPRLIPDAIRSYLSGRRHRVRNPAAVREWTYITDLLSALELLATEELGGHHVFNVGSGEVASVAQVAHLIAEHFPEVGPPEFLDPSQVPETLKRAEVVGQTLDTTLVRSLGWRPRVPLREGIGLTVAWWKEIKKKGFLVP